MILKQFAHMRIYRHKTMSQFAAKIWKMRRCSHFQVSICSGRGQARSFPRRPAAIYHVEESFWNVVTIVRQYLIESRKMAVKTTNFPGVQFHSDDKGGTRVDHD